MLNRIIIIGRITKDLELRHTPAGTPVSRFTVAVDRPYVREDGSRDTDFIDVVVWNKLAETCCQHLSKGRLVAVEGRIQSRSYEDSQGIKRKAWEVVADNVKFLDKKNGSTGQVEDPPWPEDEPPWGGHRQGTQQGAGQNAPQAPPAAGQPATAGDLGFDLPDEEPPF